MRVDRVLVGEVLKLQRRAIEVRIEEAYEEIGVRSFGRGIFHKERVSGASLGDKRVFRIEPGDLVISNVFAWEGAIAQASKAEAGRIGSHRFMTFVPADHRLDVSWARWFFLSEPGLELIGQASPGSAGRNRTLAIDRFEALAIPLPAIDEQRRVASRLGLIEDRSADLRTLFGRTSLLSAAAAVSSVTRPDLDDSTKVIRGWRKVPLGKIMTPSRDVVAVDVARKYPNVGIYSFGRGLFAKPDIDGSRTSAKTLNRIRAGQFMYSRLFAFEGAYAVVGPSFGGAFVSNEFPCFDADPTQLNARWLATYLGTADRWAELAGSSKGLGVRRQRVPLDAVLAYEVWLPPRSEQDRMVAKVDRLCGAAVVRSSAQVRAEAIPLAALNEAFAGLI